MNGAPDGVVIGEKGADGLEVRAWWQVLRLRAARSAQDDGTFWVGEEGGSPHSAALGANNPLIA